MIYEYRCHQCQFKFAVSTAMDRRNEIQVCPGCGKKEGMRVISKSTITMGGTNAQKLHRLNDDLKYVNK